ncbi:MAG: response regulator, partial [Deltaproteobacteria bacterium]|nr:response regulator [Deltaproteobacteria bacterium]
MAAGSPEAGAEPGRGAGGRPHLRGGDALEPERRPCVLIVEDEERYRRVIGMLLSDLPLELEPCASAEQALSRLGHKVPDLLVTDLRMPGMGGLEEVLRATVRRPATCASCRTSSNERSSSARGRSCSRATCPSICVRRRAPRCSQRRPASFSRQRA